MAITTTSPARVAVRMKANGVEYEADAEPPLLLASLLRDNLGLTGTHVGCDSSQWRLRHSFNGQPVKSRTLMTCRPTAPSLPTIEGISKDGEYDGVQMGAGDAWSAMWSSPCKIMTANAPRLEPTLTEAEIR